MLVAAVAGDRQAVEDLLRIVQRLVERYCRRRLSGYPAAEQLAEDVTQETLLAVATSLPTYRISNVPFMAYVFTLAHRKVVDAQRRHALRGATVDLDEVAERTDPAPLPVEVLIAKQRTAHDEELLQRMLSRLPERSALLMRMLADGMTAPQVGRRLGMKAGAVRVAHHRALRELQALVH